MRYERAGIALAIMSVLGWLGGCSESSSGPCSDCPPVAQLMVSDPVSASSAGAAPTLSSPDDVAYVSLPPGTAPTGVTATIRRVGDGGSIVTAVSTGGVDPIPVGAAAGDSIDVIVRDAAGGTVLHTRLLVAARRPPVVVRTNPPRKRKDVPLNAAIVIVFSEPVAGGSLASSVRLFRGTSPVAGTVRLLQGAGATAAFIPNAPLAANTEYRLDVTQAVQDLQGDVLEAGVTIPFATGQSSTGPATSIDVAPDTVYMVGPTYQMTATVRDAAGNELIDQPVTWSTTDSTGLTVSATGLLTARAAGFYGVSATANGLAAGAWVYASGGPAASVSISPSADTLFAGQTVMLTATLRNAAGDLLFYPSVTWTSSALALATVASNGTDAVGQAFGSVTGVSPGTVTITATSGPASGTASVTVLPPPPVASVTVTPSSSAVVVGGTVRLSATLRDASDSVLSSRPITWTSGNTTIATVDANGVVRGSGLGSTAVIATSEGVSDTATITVTVLTFASVSTGGDHTCGLTPTGAAYCWGRNEYGQLGDGSTDSSSVPVAVSDGLTFTAVSAGLDYTCGVTNTGAVYCWGANYHAQLGVEGLAPETCVFIDGLGRSFDYGCSTRPLLVEGGVIFAAVSAGLNHTCGLTPTGAAYCWGYYNSGELGNGSTTGSLFPVPVTGGLTFSSVSAAWDHSCGLTTSGAAYCWGLNPDGQLGDSTLNSSLVPVAVVGGHAFATLSAGRFHSCGTTAADNMASCWGRNNVAQLGDGTTTSSSLPVVVTGGHTFSSVSPSGSSTCGLRTDGAAYCWGQVFGVGVVLAPVPVANGLTFASLSVGSGIHACGVTTAGIAYCWGFNRWGQLGDGTTTSSTVPVKVAGQP